MPIPAPPRSCRPVHLGLVPWTSVHRTGVTRSAPRAATPPPPTRGPAARLHAPRPRERSRGTAARVQQRLRHQLEVLLHVFVHHDLEKDPEALLHWWSRTPTRERSGKNLGRVSRGVGWLRRPG